MKAAGGLALALGLCAWLTTRTGIGADYRSDAGPSIDALARGDVSAYFATHPLLGSFSLILRAPLAALAGADDLLAYRLGAFACLAAVAVLAVALERLMAHRGQPPVARLLACGILLVNPVTADALTWGHPEELLAGSLAAGCVLAATRDRPLLAGLLLGLAIATKQWALLAGLPALLAAPTRRPQLVAVCAVVVALLTLPALLANPESFTKGTSGAVGTAVDAGSRVTALNVWYPFAEPRFIEVTDGVGDAVIEKRSLPGAFVAATHIGIVLLAFPLVLLAWRRGHGRGEDALLMLALLLLLRCVLDPWDNQYYHVPFLLALASWEGLRRRGLPLVTMLVATAMWLSFDRLAPASGAGITTALYLGWALPASAWLALELYSPATVKALGKWLRTSGPSAVTATRSSIRTPKAPAT